VGDQVSLKSSTSLVSSHVSTLQSGTCHVAWRRATTDSRCSMPTLAGTPRSDQPPDMILATAAESRTSLNPVTYIVRPSSDKRTNNVLFDAYSSTYFCHSAATSEIADQQGGPKTVRRLCSIDHSVKRLNN